MQKERNTTAIFICLFLFFFCTAVGVALAAAPAAAGAGAGVVAGDSGAILNPYRQSGGPISASI